MGIDISKNQTKGIFDTYKSGKSFAYVITVCGQNSSGQRPIYPGIATRLEWNFPDPSTLRERHASHNGSRRIETLITT
jgi:arsenate reductase